MKDQDHGTLADPEMAGMASERGKGRGAREQGLLMMRTGRDGKPEELEEEGTVTLGDRKHHTSAKRTGMRKVRSSLQR